MRKGDKRTGRSFVVIRPDGRVTVELMRSGRLTSMMIYRYCGGPAAAVKTACWDDLVLFVPVDRSREGLALNRAATALVHPGDAVRGVALLTEMEGGRAIGMPDRSALLYARMMAEMAEKKEAAE